MALNVWFCTNEDKEYIKTWTPPSSLYNTAYSSSYNKTWNLPDGSTFQTTRRVFVGNIYAVYAYRINNFTTNLPATWDKTKAKIYMQNADESSLSEYDSSTILGFTSAKKLNINLAYDVWKETPTNEDGTVYVILDVMSGFPKEKYTVTTTLDNITFDNSVSEIEADSSFTFNFTAKTGYQINTLTSNIGTINISEDKLTATITGTATTNITITGTSSIIPKKYNVDYSLTNMVCDNPTSELTENESFTFTFSANEGNEIESLTSNIGNVVISQDKKTASITGVATNNISIVGLAKQVVTTYTIAYNLDNMQCVSPIYVIEENKEFNLYFTANENCIIDSLTSSLGVIEIASDKKSATITGVATDNIVITGIANKEKHYIKITGVLNNCYCNYEDNEELDNNKSCEIIALTGYIFPVKLMYSYTAVINGENVTKYANVSGDGYRLTFDFVFDNIEANIILDGIYTAEKEIDKISDFVDVFAVDNSIIKQLAGNRFLQITASTGDISYIDMGQFIVGLYVLPLGIPENLITSTKIIKMGYLSTSITAPIINGYKWIYDLGTIKIPSTYNNSYDYINTDIYLNVPFFGRIEIPSYLVGYTINISIVFDCYSGNGTLLVSNTFTNSNIEVRTQRIVTDVPYVQTNLNAIFNKLSNTNITPLIDCCFIEVIRNTPYTIDESFGYKVDENVVIGSVSGYAEFSECLIKSEIATDTEINTIKRLLNEGVIIN